MCHWSFVIGHLSLVICHWSFVIGHLSLVICHWSFVIGHLSLLYSVNSVPLWFPTNDSPKTQ
ncbi:MAG: hypothetical protein F6K31_28800 [Symploca sp. SIO2G7]|nr:hypothetical protein [Symploca sp. SIO2G7]